MKTQIENSTFISLKEGKYQILFSLYFFDWRWEFWKDSHAFGCWVGPIYFDAGKYED